MSSHSEFYKARQNFHRSLLESILTVSNDGIVSNADRSNTTSKNIAKGIADLLRADVIADRSPGQTSGKQFEHICADFIQNTFLTLGHLRPGKWNIQEVGSRNRLEIAKYTQYKHLIDLYNATLDNPALAAIIGSDYTITPDIIITRETEEDDYININNFLVDNSITNLSCIRKSNNNLPLLHASISCKWTIRSDRAQNSRSEALNLIRNRKGHLPHIVVVTAEPTPSRLASIALGTGDIDCVYHFALYELQKTVFDLNLQDAIDTLRVMVEGNRLKDISDLPLDLAV